MFPSSRQSRKQRVNPCPPWSINIALTPKALVGVRLFQIGRRGDQRLDRAPVNRDEIERAAGEEAADLAGATPLLWPAFLSVLQRVAKAGATRRRARSMIDGGLRRLINQALMGPCGGDDCGLPLTGDTRRFAQSPIPSRFVRRMVRQSPFEARATRNSPTIW